MTTKTVLHIKVDKDLKERAQTLAKQLGLPLSTVINAELARFVQDEAITFSIQPKMSAYLEAELADTESDVASNKKLRGPFRSARELFDDIKTNQA